MRCLILLLASIPCLVLLPLAGCDRGGATTDSASGAAGAAANDEAAADAVAVSAALERQIEESFASLSPEDREAAHKQGFCPIADGQLGTMGAPVKISLRGQDVFLCCEHCRSEAEADPDKTLEHVAALLQKATEEDARLGGASSAAHGGSGGTGDSHP